MMVKLRSSPGIYVLTICPLALLKKETLFENCVADVNIPVGEVFTSPRLTGTNGILHVSEVYLNELKYLDLELRFEDGRITDYFKKRFLLRIRKRSKAYSEGCPVAPHSLNINGLSLIQGINQLLLKLLVKMIVQRIKQYFFDHREDSALYLDSRLVERRLSVLKAAYEEYKELAPVQSQGTALQSREWDRR